MRIIRECILNTFSHLLPYGGWLDSLSNLHCKVLANLIFEVNTNIGPSHALITETLISACMLFQNMKTEFQNALEKFSYKMKFPKNATKYVDGKGATQKNYWRTRIKI